MASTYTSEIPYYGLGKTDVNFSALMFSYISQNELPYKLCVHGYGGEL